MAEIKIDKNLFQERLARFVSAWKTDKRSGDALFNGASSIVVLMGKAEDAAQYQKSNAIHVSCTDDASYKDEKLTCDKVLAAWLRISCDPIPLHSRWPLHRHNRKERCDTSLGSIGNQARVADII